MKNKFTKILITLALFSFSASFALAADANIDVTKVKNTQVQNSLKDGVDQLNQLVVQSGTFKSKDTALKLTILADGQVRNYKDLASAGESAFSRNAFAGFFIGPNYNSLDDFNQLAGISLSRVQQLRKLSDEVKSTETAEILSSYNSIVDTIDVDSTKITDAGQKKAKSFSLFGWLIKLF